MYYVIRIGLLGVIVLLGLVAYASETLDLVGAWSGANKKADYIVAAESVNQVVVDDRQQTDSQMIIDAINQDIRTVKYVFSKNRFRNYNQRDWWPPIFATAIQAKNSEALQYFLDEAYSCDYSDVSQGVPAFKAAITSTDSVYLEMLISSDCDTRPAQFRPSLNDLIANSKFPERSKFLKK